LAASLTTVQGEDQESAVREARYAQPEPLRQRAKVAAGVLLIVLAADLYAIVADLNYVSTANDLIAGDRIPLRELNDVDEQFGRSGIIQLVATLIASITFLLWFTRAYSNGYRMGGRPRHTKGWAVGSWFVPILNLVRPKQIADDIWRSGEPTVPVNPPGQSMHERVNPLLHAWWAAWLIGGWVGGWVASRVVSADQTFTPEDLRTEGYLYLVTDSIDILAIVLCVLVIRDITERLEERRMRFEAGELGSAADRVGFVQPPPPQPPRTDPAWGSGEDAAR
jgi:hypothetical protein